jgi:hypothetical protein
MFLLLLSGHNFCEVFTNMKNFFFFALLVILCLVVRPTVLYAQQTINTVPANQKLKFHIIRKTSTGVEVPLLNILSMYGKTYNCFFTIEEAHEEQEIVSSISSLLVELPYEEQAFDQDPLYAIDQLRQTFPQLIFEVNQSHPQIIHIVDNRLKKQANYGLNEIIPSVSFTGNSVELIKEIHRQITNVANPVFMFSHEFRDLTTTIQIKGENLNVREVLSNFIERKGTDRVLWIARTKIGQNQTTYIHFPKY